MDHAFVNLNKQVNGGKPTYQKFSLLRKSRGVAIQESHAIASYRQLHGGFGEAALIGQWCKE